MKNLIKFFITATVLFTASCTSKDLDSSIAGRSTIEVFFTTNLADSDTRTYNSGSHVDKLYYFVCDSDNRILSDLCGTCNEKVDEKFSFTLSLLRGMEYHIYFWAQKDGVYSVENGVVSIDYSNNIEANNGDLDAFYGSVVIPSDIQSATQDIQLHRPFAQLNALTNDGDVLRDNDVASFRNVKSTATIKGVYSQFDLISGTVKGKPIEITFAPAVIPSGDEQDEQDLNTNYTHISMNYLFVPTTQKCVADVMFTVTAQRKTADTDDIVIETPLYTSVPLKSNYKTNIIGKLLTNSTEFNITLDRNWGGNDEYVLGGGEVTLTEDIVANKIVVKEDTILKLNGKNIEGGQPDSSQMSGIDIAAITIENDATLTIEGEGTITGTEYGVYVKNGNVVIKGGNITAGTSAVQVYDGTAEIEGGEFSATKSNTYVINCIDACWKNGDAKVYIKGGTFHNFNPANNAAEGPNTNFCANGYTTTTANNGLTYTIIPLITISDEESYNDFWSSLNNYTGSVAVMLTKDITPTATFEVPANADVYLNLNGKTITVDPDTLTTNSNGYDYAFYIRDGGKLTIDGNGTIEATTPAPIIFLPYGDLVIENGTFIRTIPEGYNGAVNVMFTGTKPAGGSGSAGVTIKGGYFDGGYYDANAKDIEEILAGTKDFEETEDDIKKRGVSGDKNKVRVALKDNCLVTFNKSSNYFRVYGGTFVGANPAWGDEGCRLPTTPNYLRPWSNNQGAFLVGQKSHEDGIVLPEGYTITKGTHEDGRPTYTVTYSK